VVKGEGDGVMAAFEAASDAVQAAVEIQRAVAMQDRWGQLPGSLALDRARGG
jgi:class 3 adenylate cyclase